MKERPYLAIFVAWMLLSALGLGIIVSVYKDYQRRVHAGAMQ